MRFKTSLHYTTVALGVACSAVLAAGAFSNANARPQSIDRFSQPHSANAPLLAVVALAEQHISIYDATGKILEAPVSTGATGYETPAGIYSIVQKEVDHHSNLYDDASMPYMERITWTGMALHAGVLPGYPASHGCVRMPHAFAQQLYGLTELGLRVVVVREDIAPVDIEQPAMFTGRERTAEAGNSSAINVSARLYGADTREQLQSIAAAKLAEAQSAIRHEKEARLTAAKKAAEATPVVRALRLAEANLAKAEADLKAAEHLVEAADSPERKEKAEAAKAPIAAKLEAARTQLESAKAQAQSKMDAAAQAEDEAKAATAAMNRAMEAAEQAKYNTSPVSVFISRKTQRLYIRKGNYPVYEGPVTIRDVDKPIGTFVFTALNYTDTPGLLRWNVVSMYKNATNIEPYSPPLKRVSTRPQQQSSAPASPADVGGAQAALERIVVTPEAQARISEIVMPGSSLIISDEGPSNEIGKDTDFIVFMSGEPQGGIAIRQHAHRERSFADDLFGWGEGRSRGSRGGGFFSLFGD